MIECAALPDLARSPLVEQQLVQLTRHLYETCAPDLLGIYLHGSLAMGCFNPERSDIDLLAITQEPLAASRIRRLAGHLLHDSGVPRPVEISLCHYAQLHPWRHPAPFDFHFSESWRSRMAEAVGSRQRPAPKEAAPACDPALAAHFTVTRRRGVRLAGAPIADVIPEVPWPDYLDAILRDVTWAEEQSGGDLVYQTLNLCRIWAAIADGLVLSKAEGGVWALPRLPLALASSVATLLAIYRSTQPAPAIAPEQMAPVIAWLRQKLPAHAAQNRPGDEQKGARHHISGDGLYKGGTKGGARSEL